ncbi:hypothetical protein ACFXJO_32200 [Streptomyces lavendulae]|uniref:hypothetical protein n=1 Tax=Streptomyces lavendulae TaxID=1914 RepID=UPI0036C5488A
MAFGRNRPAGPIEQVPWEEITRFTVGRTLRDAVRASRRGAGPYAIRVPRALGGDMVPAVFITPAVPGAPPRRGFRLSADEGGPRPLCSVAPAGPEPGEGPYRVTAPDGRELGAVHRTPAAQRLVRHGWWLERPGQPEAVAVRGWARGGPRRTLERGAGKLLGSVVDNLLSLGAEDESDGGLAPVVWRAGDRPVLTFQPSQGPRWYTVDRDGPLDLRLAFALAVLRESEVWGGDRR